MCSLEKRIRDIISFYVEKNYDHYLVEHNIKTIEEKNIPSVVEALYGSRKEHIQIFVKDSLKHMLKDEIPEEYIVNNLLSEIFRDDELCKNRLTMEIKLHQQKMDKGTIDYNKI